MHKAFTNNKTIYGGSNFCFINDDMGGCEYTRRAATPKFIISKRKIWCWMTTSRRVINKCYLSTSTLLVPKLDGYLGACVNHPFTMELSHCIHIDLSGK